MFIPVIKIKAVLDALLTLIKADYDAAIAGGIEEESWLYRVLYGNALGDWDFYQQGVNLFTRTDASARKLQTRMGFDIGISTLPTIFVHHPNEAMKGLNTIGFGYDTDEFYSNADGSNTDKLFRGFGSVFEYVITSPSALETKVIYEVLHAALISAVDTFDEYFSNFNFTGKELIAKHESVPDPLFIQAIQIDVGYVKQVPRLGTPQQFASLVEFYPATVLYGEAIGENLI
jgi:hypothetical protein